MLVISRRHLAAACALLAVVPRARAAAVPTLEVWKMRTCPCCAGWAEHFEAAGVPADLGGCHTSKVAGYVVEGHVPVAAVQRLLAERPTILGFAVPGMPLGSPGMEIEGEPAEPYEVMAFTEDGGRFVFMEVRP